MTTTLNASTAGAGGFIATGDNSGVLALQTAGTTALTIDSSQNSTFVGNINTATSKKYQINSTTVSPLAWVAFAGASGTVSSSYNVSSVSRTATGDYTITFSNATSDANYSVIGSCSASSSYSSGTYLETNSVRSTATVTANTTALCKVSTLTALSSTAIDAVYVYVAIFGN
jgi:hypothetical protein